MAWCIRTFSAVQLAGKRDLQNNINQLTVCGMHALNVVAIIHLGVFDTENMAYVISYLKLLVEHMVLFLPCFFPY